MDDKPDYDQIRGQAAMDQAIENIVRDFPPLIRRLYLGFVGEGFLDQQAFDLARAYLVAVNSKGMVL